MGFFGFRANPDDLLKQATAQKKAGDLNGAVETLRKAYKIIAKGATVYTAETFLRLPLYLQAAKRPDEAWAEFQNLLMNGYPNQIQEGKSIDLWQIHDKMRLFLEREKRPVDAARHALFSRLYQCLAMFEQKPDDPFLALSSEPQIRDFVRSLFPKAGKETHSRIVELFAGELKKLPRIDLSQFDSSLHKILNC